MEILKTEEVAKILRVSPLHVRNLINAGRIKAYKEGRKGGFRTLWVEVERYILDKLKEGGWDNAEQELLKDERE